MNRSRHIIRLIVFIISIMAATSPELHALETDSPPSEYHVVNIGVEYYHPKNEDRRIRSAFAYALYGREFVHRLHYTLYGGIIGTAAWVCLEVVIRL